MGFTKFGLHNDLLRAVEAMGYKDPTPIQKQAIPLGMDGTDVLSCAQTGSGKTAAFVLPILHKLMENHKPGLQALVIVPTRELAAQVETAFRDLGRFTKIKTAVVIGGVGYHGQRLAIKQGAKVLVATPGRLLDHLKQGTFNLSTIRFLVLDEADRMLDMGFFCQRLNKFSVIFRRIARRIYLPRHWFQKFNASPHLLCATQNASKSPAPTKRPKALAKFFTP